MTKPSILLLSFVACTAFNFAARAEPEPCKDCNVATELTVRERIKAERALDADRVARESAARPWDGKDLGRAKRASTIPVVR
jgi:hypothetical protein